MIIDKNIRPLTLLRWNLPRVAGLSAWSLVSVLIFEYPLGAQYKIPWLPLSLVGTAVAFYLGFKNNSAYDRMWEARKIWGGIVNSSRVWGTMVRGYVSNLFRESDLSKEELHVVHRRLISRHIAWLYAFRSQLLLVKEWEHASQGGLMGRTARNYQKQFGVGLIDDEITAGELHRFLPAGEFEKTIGYQNTATQLIDYQSQDVRAIREDDLIDDFRHMELQRVLADLLTHQGKAERIKNYPLPRQYANCGSIFVRIFLLLLPIGIASEFSSLGAYGVWWSIPFSVLVGWVFYTMESIGDFSENPFQSMANDIPMFALCRTIEIDLLEMLSESEIPEPVRAKNGILM